MNRFLDSTSFAGLGTTCALRLVTAPVELASARRAATAARTEVEACERVLSRFRPDSDLSRVNASPGTWVAVDERLVEALTTALELRGATDGRCDPTLLPALVAAGYDRSYEELHVFGPAAPPASGDGGVDVDAEARRVRVVGDARFDLGATAKGLIATRALAAAWRAWPGLSGALIDLGGDLAVRGAPPDGGKWRVDVEDPRRPETRIGAIRVAAGGIATSGRGVRRLGPHGELHHLIDPGTQAPADSGPLAATAVSADPAAADAHATALAVTPVEEAAAYVEARDGLGALLVADDGFVHALGDLEFVPFASRVAV